MKWLILSYAFNIDGRAESLTVTDKISTLLDLSIQPIILSSISGNKDQNCQHHQLLSWGPSAIFFDLRHWYMVRYKKKEYKYRIMIILLLLLLFPFQVIERLFVGLSSQWSWSLPAVVKGYKLIRQNQIKFIYSSGGAWSAHYAAWILKKVTGVQWLAEMHDPIVMREHTKKIISTKYREKKFLKNLEEKICKDADIVVWFTQTALKNATKRHPILANKGIVIYPGAKPPGCEQILPDYHVYSDTLSIGHFGSLANNRSLSYLLEGLYVFFQAIPEARDKIKLHMYGAPLDKNSIETIDRLSMQRVVVFHGHKSRSHVFQKMKLSDILLLQHGHTNDCEECLPSKIYDYCYSGRPILSIYDNNPDLDKLLEKRQAYLSSSLDQSSIVNALHQIWDDWKNKSLRTPPFDPIKSSDAVKKMVEAVQKLII